MPEIQSHGKIFHYTGSFVNTGPRSNGVVAALAGRRCQSVMPDVPAGLQRAQARLIDIVASRSMVIFQLHHEFVIARGRDDYEVGFAPISGTGHVRPVRPALQEPQFSALGAAEAIQRPHAFIRAGVYFVCESQLLCRSARPHDRVPVALGAKLAAPHAGRCASAVARGRRPEERWLVHRHRRQHRYANRLRLEFRHLLRRHRHRTGPSQLRIAGAQYRIERYCRSRARGPARRQQSKRTGSAAARRQEFRRPQDRVRVRPAQTR